MLQLSHLPLTDKRHQSRICAAWWPLLAGSDMHRRMTAVETSRTRNGNDCPAQWLVTTMHEGCVSHDAVLTRCSMETFGLMPPCRPILACVITLSALYAISCASSPPITEGHQAQTRMRGKLKAEVLSCAGRPISETQEGSVTELRYYREAPMLEESGTASKGSMPSVHHGCWASLMLKDDRVEEVRYRFVPDFVDASNDCEDIFSNCGS